MRALIQRGITLAGVVQAQIGKPASVVVLGLLSLCAPWGQAQAPPALAFFKNYFVTGDYVVGGVGLRGGGDASGFATGTINIPDANSVPTTGVPAGADVVAAYLYWQTVEKSQSQYAGQSGFFNGYAISGTLLGNPNAPVSWSAGGCAGNSQGTTTLRTYRADVRPYFSVGGDGTIAATVKLADSGSNGGGAPLTLGASLVVIYRVLSPTVPLNAVILYDGTFAPGNTSSSMNQPIQGFYQPAASPGPVAKLTHIVGNGQTNKREQVYFNNTNLPSLYSNLGLPPFPGYYNSAPGQIYNGSWDNPTWLTSPYVMTTDTSEATSVVPTATNSGCVSWGAVIFSTTVQDTDNDGLLDVWEDNQGYTDLATNQLVALPGANKNQKDIFVELDYLSNLDGSASNYKHSHLPKQAAVDMVGNAFAAQNPPIHLHFDLGPNVYQGDQYVVPNGTGGNPISEGALVCTDPANPTPSTLCAFPGQPAIAWKGGLLYVQGAPALGNFQPGRAPSYHYMLFGHALAMARSLWSTANSTPSRTQGTLVSIVNSGSAAIVTIQSSPGFLKPGDPVNPGNPAFGDANLDRVTVMGAIGQPALNGTYRFSTPSSTTDAAGTITTTFTIVTSGVADGAYDFSHQTQLGLAFGGPNSISGLSDVGGGDSAVTFGLWPADDSPTCQADPSQPLVGTQTYCSNQVGTIQTQAGTLMHELGHTLALTHGGSFYTNAQYPSVPTYGLNCEPNFLSVMNYLFQARGFPDGGIDYSGQVLPALDETNLSEMSGLGLAAAHFTRWFAPPNALETMLQTSEGGIYASAHCDGTPIGANENPAVRVDGSTYSSPIDWNNDGKIATSMVASQDINFNGMTGDAPFQGVSDWNNVDLRQMDARANAFGLSSNGGINFFGGGINFFGGGINFFGGGINFFGGGINFFGGGIGFFGGGVEQDTDMANSTADPPVGLLPTEPAGAHYVILHWAPSGFGQVRKYYVWRAVGSFPTLKDVTANYTLFSKIATLSTGAPPTPTYTDTNVKNKVTYTYFITEANTRGILSTPSAPAKITVTF